MTGALKPFDTCDTVLQYFKDQAPEYLIERARRRHNHRLRRRSGEEQLRYLSKAVPLTRRAPALNRGVPPPAHSTTNVQEAGVDEPDIVKTDGKRIVAVAQARVHLVGLDGGKMTRRKTLPDTDGSQRVPFRQTSAGVQRSDRSRVPSLDRAGQASRPF